MAYALLCRINELAEELLPMPSEHAQHLQVEEDVRVLQMMAQSITAVLNDAEKREIHDESVRLWLRQLKVIAYDAEDVLDAYKSELVCAKLEAAAIHTDEAAHLPYQQEHKSILRKIWERWFQKTADGPNSHNRGKQIGNCINFIRCILLGQNSRLDLEDPGQVRVQI